MKKKDDKFIYISPEPLTFIFGLSLWAVAVFKLMDIKTILVTTIAFLFYGYSVTYGSKNYNEYCKKESETK